MGEWLASWGEDTDGYDDSMWEVEGNEQWGGLVVCLTI